MLHLIKQKLIFSKLNILKMCTRLAFQEPKYNLRHVDFDSWVFYSNNNYSLCFNRYLPQNPRGNYNKILLKILLDKLNLLFELFENINSNLFLILVATIDNFKRGQENVIQARSTGFPVGAFHELLLSILLVTIRHSLLCTYFHIKQVGNQSGL